MGKWEYNAYIYDWGAGELEVRQGGKKRGLTWAGMWMYFDEIGDQGWEMISATSVADARWGNPESSTTRMLFVFKRRKTDDAGSVGQVRGNGDHPEQSE